MSLWRVFVLELWTYHLSYYVLLVRYILHVKWTTIEAAEFMIHINDVSEKYILFVIADLNDNEWSYRQLSLVSTLSLTNTADLIISLHVFKTGEFYFVKWWRRENIE